MGTNSIFMLVVLAVIAALFITVKNKNKGSSEEWGQLMINWVMGNTKSILVGVTVFLLAGEAFIAGSIHREDQIAFDPIGRTLIHLLISLMGIVGIFGLPSASSELVKTKYSINSIATILVLITLAIAVPVSNIFLIGHSLGQPELLSHCFKYLFYSQETWLDFLYYENLPETYKPFKSIQTILLVVMISNLLSFLAFVLESLYGASKRKKSEDKKEDKDKDKDKDKDGKKADGKEEDKGKADKVELLTYKNNAHDRTVGENGLRASLIEFLLPDSIKDILKDKDHKDYTKHFNNVTEGVNLLITQWTTIDQKWSPSFSTKISSLSAKTINPSNKDALKKEIWKFLTNPLSKNSEPGDSKGAGLTEEQLVKIGLVNPN